MHDEIHLFQCKCSASPVQNLPQNKKNVSTFRDNVLNSFFILNIFKYVKKELIWYSIVHEKKGKRKEEIRKHYFHRKSALNCVKKIYAYEINIIIYYRHNTLLHFSYNQYLKSETKNTRLLVDYKHNFSTFSRS